jgi:Asp-tRNA(Asn)/Glu-tRNA(Gln) amidotransferase A subunit family amidase
MHVVSRSVRDSAALLDISQGGEPGDPYAAPGRERAYLEELRRSPGKLRIALVTEPLLPLPVAPDCVAAAERAARLCEDLGHHVEPARPQLDVEEVYASQGVTSVVNVANKVSARATLLGRQPTADELELINQRNYQQGLEVDAVTYARARTAVHQCGRDMAGFMAGYDVVLSPTMAIVPPEIGALRLSQPFDDYMMLAAAASAFTSLYNMTGQPSMSVPLHWNADNLPVGVQFTGRFGDEATLFRLAAQLEKAAPWFDRLPPL